MPPREHRRTGPPRWSSHPVRIRCCCSRSRARRAGCASVATSRDGSSPRRTRRAAPGRGAPSLVDPNGGGIFNLACASSSACVAFDDNGSVLTSTNPSGGGSSWSTPSATSTRTGSPRSHCPSAAVCVATDFAGNVLTSSTPPFNAASWSAPGIDRGRQRYLRARVRLEHQLYRARLLRPCVHVDLAAVRCGELELARLRASTRPRSTCSACPSSSTCVAIDSQGRVLTATAPFAAANWSAPSPSSIDRRQHDPGARLSHELAVPRRRRRRQRPDLHDAAFRRLHMVGVGGRSVPHHHRGWRARRTSSA